MTGRGKLLSPAPIERTLESTYAFVSLRLRETDTKR